MKPFLAMLYMLLILSCGKEEAQKFSQSNPPCAQNLTSIAIFDHYQQVLCGCDGIEDGSIVAWGNTLNCTLPVHKNIFIYYFGKSLSHQIVSTGSPNFLSSPIYLPRSESPHRVHSFKLAATGTYTFEDAFTPQLSGSFIAY